ncbi:MAG: PilT/PilU family type 4a pilus ATPase [Selenomonadaceae bacterium]|nr:PilT/PilU family type 4a pilus ATPase [Selenomonadaceae bacterium]
METKAAKYLETAIKENASDIYLTGGQRPFLRIDGIMRPICEEVLKDEEVNLFLNEITKTRQIEILRKEGAADFSYELNGRRFRGNAYLRQGKIAIALRLLANRFFTVEETGLSKVFPELLKLKNGLVLVTGKVGSGKTTTIATFLETINASRGAHIVTLEDPIEYVYEPKKSFISQREYGADFFNFADGLKHALREMPDIILVGEIRDRETMRAALMASETGILVLGTLHTKSASETALRVEGMFDKSEQEFIRAEFAEAVSAIISEELIPSANGGRVALAEILLKTSAAKNLIRQGKYSQLPSVMLSGKNIGMETKESALERLFREGKITKETFDKYKEGL